MLVHSIDRGEELGRLREAGVLTDVVLVSENQEGAKFKLLRVQVSSTGKKDGT